MTDELEVSMNRGGKSFGVPIATGRAEDFESSPLRILGTNRRIHFSDLRAGANDYPEIVIHLLFFRDHLRPSC